MTTEKNYPVSALFELTSFCNLRCVHCYMQDEHKKCLSEQEIKRCIDILYEKEIIELTLTGGEVFTLPCFPAVYKYAKEKGFLVTVLSNGTLINDKIISLFCELPPALLSISLYGSSPQMYQQVTGTGMYFEELVQNIRKMAALGIPLKLKYIGLNENRDALSWCYQLARETGAIFSCNFNLSSTLAGNTEVVTHRVSPAEAVQYEYTIPEYRAYWEKQASRKNPYLKTPTDQCPVYLCDIGTRGIVVDYQGFIHPCTKCRDYRYNIFKDEFDAAWEEISRIHTCKARRRFKCLDCEALPFCVPCTGNNVLSCGSPYEVDPAVCRIAFERMAKYCANIGQTSDKYQEERQMIS